jgi:hypothetical protein
MNARLSTPPNPPLRTFHSFGERGRGGPGSSIVIDEGGAGVEKEVVQSLPGRTDQADLIHRSSHQFQPTIPDLWGDPKPGVVEAKVGMALSLLKVVVGSAEAVNEKIRHPPLGERPPLLDIEPPHNIVGGDTPVERRRKGAEPVFAKFFKGVVHFWKRVQGAAFIMRSSPVQLPFEKGVGFEEVGDLLPCQDGADNNGGL